MALRAGFAMASISIAVSFPPLRAARAMETPGDATLAERVVSETTGALALRIPIAVPPGPGGFAPELALAYSSRGADGPFGVGWSLDLPEIRCSARFGVPDFASCARFELGDALLVRDPGAASSFHTAVESFQRIQRLGSGAASHWTVEQTDGTKLTFGASASHRITQGGQPARWLLERIEDAFGNRIEFEYAHEPGQEVYVARVSYGAPPSAREVLFLYEARPDARLSFTGGVERSLTRRLREIRVLSAGEIFRRYAFTYANAATTARSRLASVQEFGTDCTGADPVVDCAGRGLPPREFRHRDADDVGSAQYSQSVDDARYRVPFGDYTSPHIPLWRNGFPILIGDLDGDGLLDRIEVLAPSILEPGRIRILINTGSRFDDDSQSSRWGAIARSYRDSLGSLVYEKPGWRFQQVPAPMAGGFYEEWSASMYAMCSVIPIRYSARLADELFPRGATARASKVSQLRASGEGFVEPYPSLKMADVDADGLADLVVSMRLASVARHFDCAHPATPLARPEAFAAQTVTLVFRNTGTGWSRDDALASGLPPFEEIVAKSTYQTEVDEPSQYQWWVGHGAQNPCSNRGIMGFEEYQIDGDADSDRDAVCHNWIDLAPQFVDFDGDGYLDLAVLERDRPDSFWTGADYYTHVPYNTPRTRVFVQRPGAAPRWQRAPQYDLPEQAWPGTARHAGLAHAGLQHLLEGPAPRSCLSWDRDFQSCAPNTYRFDNGVRLADLNRDGLVDVFWSFESQSGVLLNTGAGSPGVVSSAWCASEPDDAPWVAGSCPEAAAYRPPVPLATYLYSDVPVASALVGDLNGDRFPDVVELEVIQDPERTFSSWIHQARGSGPSAWSRDSRFDFLLECRNCQVPHPVTGAPVYSTEFFPRYEAIDLDGDGSDDVVGDTDAFLSRSRHSDLVRAIANGRGGSIDIEYQPMNRQREDALEASAASVPWAEDAGRVALWRPTPVVSRITATGPNLASPGSVTDYRYARPRFSAELRSDLGFALVRRTRSGGTAIESFFYQDLGRTGRTAMRLVKDGGNVVHHYRASWEIVRDVIPGSIAGVHLARLAWDQSAYVYDGTAGALQRRWLSYDDAHGYNFVTRIETQRPSSHATRILLPESPDLGRWIIGLVREVREEDQRSSWSSRSQFSWTAEGRLASATRERDRGDGSVRAADTILYVYDRFGNLLRRTDANGHATEFGYDASGTVRTSRTDPALRDGEPGRVTRWTAHPVLAQPVAADPGYTDEPRTELVLDAFGRTVETWQVPRDRWGTGERVLVSAMHFADAARPAYVERLQFVDEQRDAIRTVVVDDGFGSPWKTIRDAGPASDGARFAGSATWRDPARRTERTTYDRSCGSDPLCRNLTGAAETPAKITLHDAIGRALRVETPRGTTLTRYSAGVEQIATGESRDLDVVDIVWDQNPKGDLTRRALDDDRVLLVDECTNSDPARATLADASCAAANGPNRTLYAYHASGQLESVHDAVGVASYSEWASPRHWLRYRYDTAGQRIAIDDPDAGHSEVFYDGVGNVVKTVNARGFERLTGYDPLDRRTRISTPEGPIAFSYRTGERQLESESGPGYSKTFIYDRFGRVASEDTIGFNIYQGASFTFDLLGRRTSQTAVGTTVRYEYEGAFLKRVCGVPFTSQIACGHADATAIVSDVSYDALGRRSAVRLPGGVRTFTYADAYTRDLREDKFVGASTLAFEYAARDPLGNVLDWAVAGPPGTNAAGRYTFDARDRIASRTRTAPGLADASESFAYDALGNLTSLGGEAQRFEHPSKPHALTSRGTTQYAYDASGNRIRAGSRFFRFDSADRLSCVGSISGACDVLRVIYDADGNRVAERGPGMRRSFVGAEQVRTITSAGDATRLEISAMGERVAYTVVAWSSDAASLRVFDVDVPPFALALAPAALLACCLVLAIRGGLLRGLAQRPAGAALAGVLIAALVVPSPAFAAGGTSQLYGWVISDGLGSGLAELDETGRLVHETRFEPFGGVDEGEYHAASATPSRRYFAGHPEQSETGLYYMNARWLDPETGMFASVDPVVAAAGDPQSFNAYAYARNNPVRLVDPTGAVFNSPLQELQNCNRCSGFSFVAGAYFGVDGQSGWITSESQYSQIQDRIAEARAAAGWASLDAGVASGAAANGAIPDGSIAQSGMLAAVGSFASAVGNGLARIAEIVAWDVALAMIGIVGNVFGIAAGLLMAVEGAFLLDPPMLLKGFEASFWALVPRYGFWSGPGWGKPTLEGLGFWFGPFSNQSNIESATYNHDYATGHPGADRALIREVWAHQNIGPFGQLYRVGLTGLFETKIAVGWGEG